MRQDGYPGIFAIRYQWWREVEDKKASSRFGPRLGCINNPRLKYLVDHDIID